MFRLLYKLLSTKWFRRALLLVFGLGFKLLRLLLPDAAEEWERLVESEGSGSRNPVWLAVRFTREVVREASDDELTLMASSMAFYVMLALGPLMVVVLGIAELVSPLARSTLVEQISLTFGTAPAQLIGSVVESGNLQNEHGVIAIMLGALVLIFNIAGVFAGMQSALNRIWHVKAQPSRCLWHWLGKRLFSLLLLVVMALCIALAAVSGPLIQRLVQYHLLANLLSICVSFALLTLIFALILQYLPDVKVPWRLVWLGAIATTLLFLVGRSVISLYLLHGGVATTYGAAASFVVLMLAVFYNAMILFLGAEITQVHARLRGVSLVAERLAEPLSPNGADGASDG